MQLLKDIILSSTKLSACALVVITLFTESSIDNGKVLDNYQDSIYSVEELFAGVKITPVISFNKQCESVEHTCNHFELYLEPMDFWLFVSTFEENALAFLPQEYLEI